jgi:riboflavin-specific deaminase-like protein
MAAVADAVDDVVDAARAALERGLREARSGAGDKPVRPFVTLSFAQSLDGCVARERGQPYALSSRESLVMTHRLRAMHAGILVGVGTVLADNPALTVRLCDGASPRPVVLDSTLRTPPSAKVCERAPLLLHVRDESAEMRTRREALVRRGAETIECSALANGRVDLADALSRLAARVPSLMVEVRMQMRASASA